MTISPAQSRAARALLNDMSIRDLSAAVGITANTISRFERGEGNLSAENMNIIEQYFALKVEFIHGGAIPKREKDVEILKGKAGFRAFMDRVYAFAQAEGGRISILNGRPELFIKWLGKDWYDSHKERMLPHKNKIDFRIIVGEHDTNFIATGFAQYRTLPDQLSSEDAVYIFGTTFGLFRFQEDELIITVCNLPKSNAQLHWLFDFAWEKADKP